MFLFNHVSRITRRYLHMTVMCMVTLGLCQTGWTQSGTGTTKVRYEEVVRSVLYAPMYVAIQKGYFKEAGLDVGVKTSQGADKGMAALLSGSADIILLGPESSIYVTNSESPVKPKIFSGLIATDGFILVSRKPVEKFSWDMVKGKTIMGFRPGSAPDVFLETALRKNKLDPKKDVKIVNNIGPAARVGAWLSGQGDFAIFLEPEVGTLESQHKAFVMTSIGQEVGLVDFTVFTTTDAYIKQHPQVVQAWTNTIARALKYVEAAPAEDIAEAITPFFTGLSKPELITAINRYRTYAIWKTTPLVEAPAMNTLQDMLTTSGLLKASDRTSFQQLVAPDFAKKAAQ